jgi:DNA mismatch endonuclease (patch repair protein)
LDKITPQARSKNMSRIRSKDTSPEIRVRKLIFGMGYRYRVHSKVLPGRPDVVFASRKAVIFIHGCFWHQHQHCVDGRLPSSRVEYWLPKLQNNVTRDAANERNLVKSGWRVLTIWECEAGDMRLAERIREFLDPRTPVVESQIKSHPPTEWDTALPNAGVKSAGRND